MTVFSVSLKFLNKIVGNFRIRNTEVFTEFC